MRQGLLPSIFTIDINDTPILSFEALNFREAHELCREEWLKSDLLETTSRGVPLWDGRSRLRARIATRDEAGKLIDAASAVGPSGDLLLVYHVEQDGSLQ